ncbi:PKD domain-containing protein [Pseudaestuariivita rosea]|uniref:PKD domain-containing protein n=1 Tax=Pseudaestuariivita rosea TaxID=2763263 RepID=UPI001ABB4CE4|nr:RHS repeat-associated core domain-containing protein [Pseudaestuariivita rosea]
MRFLKFLLISFVISISSASADNLTSLGVDGDGVTMWRLQNDGGGVQDVTLRRYGGGFEAVFTVAPGRLVVAGAGAGTYIAEFGVSGESRTKASGSQAFDACYHLGQCGPVVSCSVQTVVVPVSVGQGALLDATSEVVTDQTGLRPQWRWESRPDTSVADLSATDVLRPGFTPDVAGTYVAALDLLADGASAPALSVTVEAGTGNLRPVARLQGRGLPGTGDLTLDGSDSFDANGDQISYVWSVEAAPDGSALSLAGAAGPLVDVALDVEGDYTFGLAVQDGDGLTSGVACYEVTFTPGGNTDIWLPAYDLTLPNDGSDRVTFTLGDVSNGPALDILIPSFDVNGGHETTFDTLTFTFRGKDYSLSSTREFLDFVSFIEFDTDGTTDALISPNPDVTDFTLDFGTDRGSVTLQNIVGSNLGRRQLEQRSVDYYEGAFTRQAEPRADARFDQLIVPVGTVGALDPHRSTDIDGDVMTSEAGLVVAPAGSAAALAPAGEGIATLAPDVAGDYLARIAVSDGLRTRFDTVLVTTEAGAPVRPVARIAAGAANAAALGTPVALDGSQSYDFNGDLLSYEWTLIHAPQASLAAITDPGLPFAGLTPDVAGDYVVQLVVRDGAGASTPATALIRVPEVLPVAVAGPDLAAPAFGFVTLDGGLSSVGADARYDWALTGLVGDVDRAVTLTGDATSAIWTLEVLQPGDPQTAAPYAGVAQLIAADGNGVARPEAVFIGSGNLRPVVQGAGRIEAEAGVPVDLRAADYASDINGDALSHSWSLLYRPQGSAAQVDPANGAPIVTGDSLSFTADRAGIYLIQLTAEDGNLRATPAVILLEVTNSAPVAVATGPDQVFVGQVATLDGTGSFDPDGNALSYSWTIVSAPAGSTATIPDPFGPTASFTPDLRGAYSFGLVVSDFELSSDQAVVSLSVPNRAPVVLISGPDTLEAGVETLIDATGSTDPDGDVLSFVFEVTSAPTGADFTFAEVAAGQYGFVSQDAGDYTIEVTVSDGIDTVTEVLALSVVPGNTAPVLGPVRDLYTVELGLEFVLDLTASDADGDVLTFYATPLPLPTGVSFDANTGAIRFRPETGQEGQYQFTVGVSDGVLTDEAVLTIDVVPGTASDTAVFGRVLDAVDFANGVETPLAGMPVRLADSALMDMTDAEGRFRFGSLAEGRDRVFIEPSADGGPGGYIGVNRAIRITANQERDLAPDFLLTPLNDGCATVVAGQDTVLNGVQSGVTVTIAADTVQDSAGAAYTGEVCLGSLPELFQPASMPDTVQACRIYALDAPGAVFTQGLQITAPNVDALPEGARLSLWQVGTNTGRFRPSARGSVDAGAATVSATLTGAGGLFTFLPQAPVSRPSDDQPTGNRSLTVFEGDMSQTYALPGYRSFNRDQQVALSYHSTAADPTVIVAGDVTIAADASLPVTLDTNLDIGGLAISDLVQWTPREGADGSTPALVGEELTLRQSTPVDATGLPSGRYPYTFTTRANYACSTVGASHQGELYVQNQTDSPYGKGWSIDGLQKLTQTPDGAVAIIDNDTIATFNPKPTLTEFEDEPLTFPSVGTQNVGSTDYNGDGLLDVFYGSSGTGEIRFVTNFGDGDLRQDTPIKVADPNDVPETGVYPPNLLTVDSGELNGDGSPDIAYALQVQDGYGFIENDGFGGFDIGFNTLGLSSSPRDLEIADIDGDGFDDIVYVALGTPLIGFGRNEVWIDFGGDGSNVPVRVSRAGLERNTVLQVLIDDIDADGDLDIAYRALGGLDFVYNNGNRSFTLRTLSVGDASPRLLGEYAKTVDTNGDGLPEVIWNNETELQVYPNIDGASFGAPISLARPPAVTSVTAVNIADANGDDLDDLILSGPGQVYVYSNNGDGTFAPFETGFVNYSFGEIDIADINGDGSLDLISSQRFTATVHFSKPSATGEFRSGRGEFSTLTKLPDGTWQRVYPDGNTVEFDANGLQTAIVDTNGNRISYVYDDQGRLIQITDMAGLVTTMTYGAAGFLEAVTDPDGRVTLFGIDENGLVSEITEPDNERVGFGYDDDGRMTSSTDQRGNTYEFNYGEAGDLTGVRTPDGASVSMSVGRTLGLEDFNTVDTSKYVEPEDRITTVTDKRGGVTETTLNQFGAAVRIVDPLGRVTTMDRNDDSLVTRIERPFGSGQRRVDTIAYDADANITEMTEAVGTSVERTSSYVYGDLSRLIEQTDPDGFVTRNEFDANGNMIRTIMPEGDEMLMSYNARGLMTSTTDPNGNVTLYDYDINSNVSFIRSANNIVTTMDYNDAGQPVQVTEAAGDLLERVRVTAYDVKNRPVQEIDALGNMTSFGYDAYGNQVRFEDQAGRVSNSFFDSMNRPAGGEDPMTGTSNVTYNPSETETTTTDAEGRVDIMEMDILGRLSRMIEPNGTVRRDTYDDADLLATMIDAKGGVTSFEYDALGRAVRQENPEGEVVTTEYDNRDNVTRIVPADGSEVTFSYDGNNRLTEMVTADNRYAYTYDDASNLLSISDNDSTITMTYDELNRVVTETVDYTNLLKPVTLTYEYDALGRRVKTTDSYGGEISITYDAENRQTQVTQPWGGVIDFTFDPDGRVRSKQYENGTLTEVDYDAGGRLASLTHEFGGATFHGESFDYDLSGRMVLLRDLVDLSDSRTLIHDVARRLIGVNVGVPAADGGVPIPAEDYAYDLEDNRTASHLTTGYIYDDSHRLLENADFMYAYDLNGNRTSRTDKASGEIVTYSWDAQDQLIGMTASTGWSISYAYDANQRRIGKSYTDTAGVVTDQAFVYDGPNVLFVFTTRDGVTTARRWMNAYGLDKRYGFEDYTGAVPTPGTGTVYEVHQDYLGSIVAVVDATSGSLVSEYSYDSFGQRTVVNEAVATGSGFTGHQYDSETGLGYFRARYYDPVEGRFLSEDPMGFPDGIMNSYAYVANAPYQFRDPFGLTSTPAFLRLTDDATTNDIYSSVIAGAAIAYLMRSLDHAFDQLDMLGVGGGSNNGGTTSGGRGPSYGDYIQEYIAKCRPIYDPDSRRLAPPRLDPQRDNHGGDDHRGLILKRVRHLLYKKAIRMRKIGANPGSLRMNQAQVDAGGRKVSTCRPDIQYSWAGNTRHQLEEVVVSASVSRTWAKLLVMADADKNAGIYLFGRR